MRFMLQVRAGQNSEAGMMPSRELVAAMGAFNQTMIDAGVMLAADGLHPSSKGARVAYDGDKRSVTQGPFAAANELIAGFWIIDVGSKEDAIAWAKRAPFAGGVVEIRQIFEAKDVPPEILSAEAAACEEARRERLRPATAPDRS